MADQAIASAEELERFARDLQAFNRDLHERMSRLQGQFVRFGDTWRDAEHQRFAQEFVDTVRVFQQFLRVADDHSPFLLRKAKAIRDYHS